jgi:hypothetical protein
MNNDPLALLRDIRLPVEPDWWPLAFGWWIVAALILVGCIVLTRLMARAYKARRPTRAAKQLMQDLFEEHSLGGITDLEFVHRSNSLLKRLFVVALRMDTLAKASNTRWLQALDTISNSNNFSSGSGQILGLQRFNPNSAPDIQGLKRHLTELLAKVHPTKTKQLFVYNSTNPALNARKQIEPAND